MDRQPCGRCARGYGPAHPKVGMGTWALIKDQQGRDFNEVVT